MIIKNKEVFDGVMECLDDMRKKMRKSGAERGVFEDIAMIESALWDAMEPEIKPIMGGGNAYEPDPFDIMPEDQQPKGQGQGALFSNPNGHLPTGDIEIDRSLGLVGGDRQ